MIDIDQVWKQRDRYHPIQRNRRYYDYLEARAATPTALFALRAAQLAHPAPMPATASGSAPNPASDPIHWSIL